MLQGDRPSLWRSANAAGNLASRFLSGDDATVTLGDLVRGSILSGRVEELRGRSVLVATTSQLAAALALIELDGTARRLVLYPPDLSLEHVPFVIASARVDAIVTDRAETPELETDAIDFFIRCSPKIDSANGCPSARHQTEWVLLTSGTTGRPKMVLHTLSSLAGAIAESVRLASPVVWSTFYDIRRYGGLQIFLRAVLTGGSLVLSSDVEATANFLTRAGGQKVTHISGTPSHWRRALMSTSARKLEPRYVRLSGEIVDQSILDKLRSFYPHARVVHAFASTEAGVAFSVSDGLAGFPASLIEQQRESVEMKVEGGSLRIRSFRTAIGYIEQQGGALADADGFVDTGDAVERCGDRYYFVGRRDGVINVGGQKVHPEEVESVINRHPQVRMSLVRMRKNPVMGSLVVADVVIETSAPGNGQDGQLEHEILQLCRGALPKYKVPVSIHLVSDLPVAATGKLVRRPCAMSS